MRASFTSASRVRKASPSAAHFRRLAPFFALTRNLRHDFSSLTVDPASKLRAFTLLPPTDPSLQRPTSALTLMRSSEATQSFFKIGSPWDIIPWQRSLSDAAKARASAAMIWLLASSELAISTILERTDSSPKILFPTSRTPCKIVASAVSPLIRLGVSSFERWAKTKEVHSCVKVSFSSFFLPKLSYSLESTIEIFIRQSSLIGSFTSMSLISLVFDANESSLPTSPSFM